MRIIDSHQHFWKYEPSKHAWIDDEMKSIRRDFLPAELQHIYDENGVVGSVAVEADQQENETEFLIELSNQNPFIKAVVGYTDLRSEGVKERLTYFSQFPVVKGFRHVLQSLDPSFMLQSSFLRGIGMLREFGYTYDVLVFPHHLTAVKEMIAQFPDQPFVLDHLAKPYIKNGLIDEWEKDIRILAGFPNLYCKISGMVTEADYINWKQQDFTPYLDVVLNAFGINRIMFGSDWPVCTVAASYGQVLAIIKDYFATFSAGEQEAVFSGNTIRFYNL